MRAASQYRWAMLAYPPPYRLVTPHDLVPRFGDTSPLGRRYAADAVILQIGVTHSTNTSFHLAEWRAEWPGKPGPIEDGAALLVDGERRWWPSTARWPRLRHQRGVVSQVLGPTKTRHADELGGHLVAKRPKVHPVRQWRAGDGGASGFGPRDR